jgi:DNA repair protein RadC
MSIIDWPEQERPREKLLRLGASALTNAELLGLVILKGVRHHNAIEVARGWLHHYQGLSALFNADYASLSQQLGIGLATYCQLKACIELQKRYLEEQVHRHGELRHSADAKNFLIASLRHYEHEVFACLFLDSQHRLIRFEKLFDGSLRQTQVHIREVVKRALLCNAAALIVAHNHPSGIATPSPADQTVTQALTQALILIEVKLLDHIIVGGNETYSFAEAGMLV